MVTTNHDEYANKLRLIRNHGEAVPKQKNKRIFLIALVLTYAYRNTAVITIEQ